MTTGGCVGGHRCFLRLAVGCEVLGWQGWASHTSWSSSLSLMTIWVGFCTVHHSVVARTSAAGRLASF